MRSESEVSSLTRDPNAIVAQETHTRRVDGSMEVRRSQTINLSQQEQGWFNQISSLQGMVNDLQAQSAQVVDRLETMHNQSVKRESEFQEFTP